MTSKEIRTIDGLRAGDEVIIGQFVSKYRRSLMAQALRIVKVREDAEEVVQDTFAIVCRKIAMFNGESSLYTWVSRILINCALMKVRSRRVEQRVIVRSLDELVGDGLDLHETVPDNRPDQHSSIELGEYTVRLSQAVTMLPKKYRRMFKLKVLKGLSNQEISDWTGDSIAAVKSMVHRMRLYLQRMDCNNSGRVYLEQAHTKPKVGVEVVGDSQARINLVAVRDNRACGGRKFRRVKYGKSGLNRFKTPWNGREIKEAV